MIAETRAQETLFVRQRGYIEVFNKNNVYLQEVLEDLKRFCRAESSCFHEDPRMHAVLEGRREVWLRIQDHLNLTSEQLWKKYGQKKRR